MDNDCDGSIDEDCHTWYADTDNDTYGDPNESIQSPTQPDGYVADNTDCDDNNTDVSPASAEVCNGIDDDCDGSTDEGCTTWYADTDGDGYGDPAGATESITQPAGYVADSTDCNDGNAAVNPGAIEVCNGIDDDCDGSTDEGCTTWYADTDGDGYGDPAGTTESITQPAGYVADSTDCNDGNAAVNPGAIEVCNGIDDDCDGATDEGCTTWYADTDGDGYGDPAGATESITQPAGYVADSTDCNDGNAAVNPGAIEVCNGIDDDCDGATDEGCTTWYADTDGDGYGDLAGATESITQPARG